MGSNKKFLFNVKILFLPLEFLWLTDKYIEYLNQTDYNNYLKSKGVKLLSNYKPEDDIIIEHPECLTLEELAAEQGAAKDRVPRLYEKMVGNQIACSKYAGFLWEYILFENKEQLSNYKPYLTYMKTASINDMYAEGDEDEEQIKPPYSIIKFEDKYGERYNPVAEKNKKMSNTIKDILKSFLLKEDTITIVYEANPNGNPKKLHLEYDDETSNIYCNFISPLIIALFSLNKKVIFISEETKNNIKTINKELSINKEIELIFENKFNYTNIDKIEILKSPMFFKPTRVLYHLLMIIDPELPFIQGFSRIFKSSQLFAFSIRISMYKSSFSSKSPPINPEKIEEDKKKKQKQLLQQIRFKLLKEKGERKESSKRESPKRESSKSKSPKRESSKRESSKSKSPKRESSKRESPQKESPQKESPQKESPKKESPKKKNNVLVKNKKICPEGKILNPETNRCVSITGKIGMAILKKMKEMNKKS